MIAAESPAGCTVQDPVIEFFSLYVSGAGLLQKPGSEPVSGIASEPDSAPAVGSEPDTEARSDSDSGLQSVLKPLR